MSITKEQLPKNIWESIENLMTLLEIGTGSDTQDEFIKDGVQAIAYLLDEAIIPAIA